MNNDPEEIRRALLLTGLDIEKPGLEVSPLYRPIALKSRHNVFYTDYTSAEDSRSKHSNYDHAEIMDIDFIWTPGVSLSECVPVGKKFHWAIASHVLEHVPDPIGWLLEVFEVLEVGAVFSLALPDKHYCFDKFRRETDVADLIDQWVRKQRIPSPRQLYDFLSRSVDFNGKPYESADQFQLATRNYTDEEALNFVINSWTTGTYFDAHCSVFTPESFYDLLSKLNAIGIINVEASQPLATNGEFHITLRKLGEPKVVHPGGPHKAAVGNSAEASVLNKDLAHARNAFVEAVAVQDQLKATIARLDAKSGIWQLLRKVRGTFQRGMKS